MSYQPRPLSARGRVVGLSVGTVSLLGEAAVLLGYVLRFGLDRYVILPLVLAILAAFLLILGGTNVPQRVRPLRVTVGILCFFSFVVLEIAAFPATSMHDSDTAGGLLSVAGLCLIVTAPCVLMVGRPRR